MFGYHFFKSENALLSRNVFSCFLKELREPVAREIIYIKVCNFCGNYEGDTDM